MRKISYSTTSIQTLGMAEAIPFHDFFDNVILKINANRYKNTR